MASSLRLVLLLVLALTATCDALRRHRGDSMMNAGLGLDSRASTVPDQWFSQKLDHSDVQNNATFQQRYQVNATHYKVGGPVFLLLGGEGPASGVWLSIDTAIMMYAKNYNAVVVQLEHRFYGKSQPFNDISTAHLQYLTSEQALADAASFTAYLTANLSLPNNTKWVVFGGSYSGALAGWFRIKYPNLVVGAVATSSPVLAKVNFFEYEEVAVASLQTTEPADGSGTTCIGAMQEATSIISAMLISPVGRQLLVNDFRVCDSDLTGFMDQQNFWQNIANNFDNTVQYNRDNREFEGGDKPPTIDDLCNLMRGNSDPYMALVSVNNLMLGTNLSNCLNVSYNNYKNAIMDDSLNGTGVGLDRQWIYQTCNEFGYYQTTDTTLQYFGLFNITFFLQQCKDIFNIEIDAVATNVKNTNINYGGKNISSTNIVFPNGSIDPWHVLSITEDISPSLTAIYIQGTAHCANMYPPSDSDPQQLKDARAEINTLIGTWLSQ